MLVTLSPRHQLHLVSIYDWLVACSIITLQVILLPLWGVTSLLRAKSREIKNTNDGFAAAKDPWRPGYYAQLTKRATNNDNNDSVVIWNRPCPYVVMLDMGLMHRTNALLSRTLNEFSRTILGVIPGSCVSIPKFDSARASNFLFLFSFAHLSLSVVCSLPKCGF